MDPQTVKLIELFHTPDGTPYATTDVDGDIRTVPVKSDAYRSFIRRQAFLAGGILTQADVRDHVTQDADIAVFEGKEHPVYIRVGINDGFVFHGLKARKTNRIFIDLCDGNFVCVTSDGWEVTKSPACKFRRAAGMLPLPTPVPGDIHLLRPFVNTSDEDYRLFLTLLVAAFRYGRPTPITLITGEHGSGKTTLARIFRRLVDPSSAPVQTASNSERDLQIAAANSWVVNIDNQSRLSDALSDNLCRLATGSGLRTRTLYTDSDEQIFNAVRPILMNSIEELATRPDFLDRTVHLHTHEIKTRRPEEEMWAEFDKVAPQILGGLMTAVSFAMKDVSSVKGAFPRMADFARWSIAAAPALGFTGDDFIMAYEENRRKSTTVALDDSPIYLPLHHMLKDGDFQGTTKELLKELTSVTSGDSQRDLPRNERALSAQLDRLTPNLRADGIIVKRLGRDSVRRVQILEVTKVRSQKEIAAKAKTEAFRQWKEDIEISQACQDWIVLALSTGPRKRRDVRKMAAGEIAKPDGTMEPRTWGAAKLDANAKALGVVTVDKGKDGIWWSLPETE